MIEIKDLTFSYPLYEQSVPSTQKNVLNSFSLSVSDKQRVLILAPPDSGKTTLLKILCGGIPTYGGGSISGQVIIDQKSISSTSSYELTEVLTYVSQNPQEQLLMNTCCDEIAFPLESLSMKRSEIQKRIDTSLSHWGLTDLSEVHPQELSGGERKRLLLAVTEAINAPNWLLDEVFDDLDINYKKELLHTIKEHTGSVIVCASRFLPEFSGFFDKIVTIDGGACRPLTSQQVDLTTVKQIQFTHNTKVENGSAGSTLTMSDARITHLRKSVVTATTFTLSIPSLSISQGEIVALVGPNGSGKSTLSRVLCGLDPYKEGSLTVDGQSHNNLYFKENVGYMFQNPDYSIFLPTVYDELTYSLKGDSSISKKERDDRAKECASVFKLNLDDNPSLMSFGERKRLQAAVYYLLDRSFIIIDELDGGITYEQAFSIISIFHRKGCGVIIISHDKAFADAVAMRTYEIHNGVVTLRGIE